MQDTEFSQMIGQVVQSETDVPTLQRVVQQQAGRIAELQATLADKNRLLEVNLNLEELHELAGTVLEAAHKKFMADVGQAMVDGIGVGSIEHFTDAHHYHTAVEELQGKLVRSRRKVLEAINGERDDLSE